jgi:hypothetical protein
VSYEGEDRSTYWNFGLSQGKKLAEPSSQLLWIQSEIFELLGSFGESITKSFDADAARQAALDRSPDVKYFTYCLIVLCYAIHLSTYRPYRRVTCIASIVPLLCFSSLPE